jgi:replication factor A2
VLESPRPPITENTYVRTWGQLKAYNNKRHLGAHYIRPIEDMNEVNYHMLEATMVHLYFTKGSLGEGGATSGANGASNGVSNGGGEALPPGTSTAARKVFHVLKDTPSGNEGLHIQDIAARANLEYTDVAKGGDELLTLGLIYTTVDDHTWQLLNMDNNY